MAAYKHLKHDKEFVEVLRAREWHRSGYRGMVQSGDEIRNIPDGWPEGVDGEEVVAEWIFERTEKMRKGNEEAVAQYHNPGPMEERFGKLLEGEE